MILEYLIDNNLIIVPSSLKKKIISEINSLDKLVSYKIMSLEEFLNNYFFSYDKKSIIYTMNKYNVNTDIALEYLNSLYFVGEKEYSSNKLNKLVSLKQDLVDNNLLYFNDYFSKYLENTNIIILGYDLDPFYVNIFSKYRYKVINIKNNKKDLNVLEFKTLDDEVAYICYDIKNKLDSGIDINNIKIINNGNEYDNTLKRIFSFSNIPLNLDNKISLYDIEIGKRIISMLKDNYSLDEIIKELSDIKIDILNKIINIFNNYVDIDSSYYLELISYDLKHTYIKDNNLNNAVNIISFDEVEDSDIVYVIGFNKENYPIIHKDLDFLSDKMKKELGLFTSEIKNKHEKEKLINNLYKNNNFIITYKLKDSFNNYNNCVLIKDLNLNVIKNPLINYNFSNIYNKLHLIKEYDNYYKYGIISEDLKILRSNYKDLKYQSYDNSFTGIDKNKYLANFEKLSLSYTTIDNYFRCSFRYYITSTLNIKEENTDTFYIEIGNIFHYVLSKYRDNDFNFDEAFEKEASKYTFTLDKLIFLNKLKEELKYDIEIIKKQENYTNLHKYLFEKRFSIPIANSYNKNIYFTGVVDKIIYDTVDNKDYISIIDYKTGTLHTDLNNVLYGIGMQLPVYLYLIKNSNLFNDSEIVGFYLQKIINKDMKKTPDKTIDELKENALKLVGYSNSDSLIISKYDMTYMDSSFIASLKQKNDGSFYSYSRVLNNNEIAKLADIVDNNITKAATDIIDANFSINPKKIGNSYVGCEFCSFRDLCFKKEEDYVELEKKELLDFLGGEDNA